MAAHIVLEDSGEKYEPLRMYLANGEQRTPEYLKKNPLGRVPLLRLDHGDLSLIGFFASSVHPAHVSQADRHRAGRARVV
jgi:glutathione S-transferase